MKSCDVTAGVQQFRRVLPVASFTDDFNLYVLTTDAFINRVIPILFRNTVANASVLNVCFHFLRNEFMMVEIGCL